MNIRAKIKSEMLRKLTALLILTSSLGVDAQAQQANPSQINDNNAISQPVNSQQNQSRSESIGGGIYNYQLNPAQGDLGEMTVGARAISCQSPSFFANAGILPYDNQYFGTFDNNSREKDWMPQGTLGLQMPFGPQVASCVSAMKYQTLQTQMTTESGVLAKCIETMKVANQIKMDISVLEKNFSALYTNCKSIWENAKLNPQEMSIINKK
jgi:hypothetical protein